MSEIKIKKKKLREALSAITKVVSKATLPILAGVRIQARDGAGSITATNLEETLSWSVGECSGSGDFIVDFKTLKELVAKGKSTGEVDFRSEDELVKASFQSDGVTIETSLELFPVEDWAETPQTNLNSVSVSGTILDAMRMVAPSVSKDPTRKVLQSILLDKYAVVATNGSQLIKFDCRTGVDEQVLVPVTKFITSKYFSGAECRLGLDGGKENPTWIGFENDEWKYSLRVTEGAYPDYTRVIPKESSASLSLNVNAMERLRNGIPMLQCDSELHTVHLHAVDDRLMIMPEKFENPGVVVDCEFKGVISEPLAVSVDGRLLSRALDLGLSILNWSSGDAHAPIMATDGKGNGLFVFMPLRGGDVERIAKEAEVFLKRKEIKNRGAESQVNKNQTSPTIDTAVGSNMEDKMIDEKKVPNESLRMQGTAKAETQSDPLENLLAEVVSVRLKARDFTDGLVELQKQVKEVQRLQRQKEREFKHTRDLLGKLKKVSGF